MRAIPERGLGDQLHHAHARVGDSLIEAHRDGPRSPLPAPRCNQLDASRGRAATTPCGVQGKLKQAARGEPESAQLRSSSLMANRARLRCPLKWWKTSFRPVVSLSTRAARAAGGELHDEVTEARKRASRAAAALMRTRAGSPAAMVGTVQSVWSSASTRDATESPAAREHALRHLPGTAIDRAVRGCVINEVMSTRSWRGTGGGCMSRHVLRGVRP